MKLTSLIVDDNEFSIVALRHILSKHGVSTFTAGNNEQALQVYSAVKPDVVFVDYLLQDGLRGDEVIRALRQQNKFAFFYAITADGSKETDALLREAGAISTLCKPYSVFEIKNVVEVVKQAVSFRRKFDANSA